MRISSTFLGFAILLVGAALASLAGVPSPAPDAVGPPELVASTEVQALLAEAASLLENRRWEPALAKADQALDVARGGGDRPGVALSLGARAGALMRLKRIEEAVAAWREATAIWQDLDDRPRRVEGAASMGALLLAQDAESTEGNELLEQALEVAKQEEALHPLPTAQALHDGALAALASAQFENATRLFAVEVAILEQHAPASVALAESLIGLGRAQTDQGADLAIAWAALDRALDIAKRVAPGSAVETRGLLWKGRLERVQQNYPEARNLLQQALAIQDVVDPYGYTTFLTLKTLGDCEIELGDFDAARRCHLRGLSILERISAEPKAIASCINALGMTEFYAGHLEAAEAYFERALGILENFGDETGVAAALINLGNVAAGRFQYGVARQRYERALAIVEQQKPAHPLRGIILINLRRITFEAGDYELAAFYSAKTITYYEEYSPGSVEHGFALEGAGDIALIRGEPLAAKTDYRRSLEIMEGRIPGSERVTFVLHSLGHACLDLRELDQAESYLRRALEIEAAAGRAGTALAEVEDALGHVMLHEGAYGEAERHLRHAVQVWEGIGGLDYLAVADPLHSLAQALWGLGQLPGALDAAQRSESLRSAYLRSSSHKLTEREALLYGARNRFVFDLLLTLAVEPGETIPQAARRALDAVVRSRAVVLDDVASRNRQLWKTSDPELARLADDYADARDDLATLVVQGPKGLAAEFQTAIDEARAAKERAERALASKSSAFRRELAMERAGFDDVSAALSSAGGLVAFVHFNRVASPSGHEVTSDDPTMGTLTYAAFVLAEGASEPVMVSLGSAEEIDRLVAEHRQQISSTLAAGALAGKRATDQYRSVGTQLRERVWDPVARQLGESSRVFVVPDGALNLVDLAALPVGDSEYLVETGPRIHYLSAERDVLAFEGAGGAGGLLALGDPAFDEPSLFAALAPAGASVELDESYRVASAGSYRGLRSSCAGFASMHFEPLPETGGEVDEVVRLWNSQARHHLASAATPSEAAGLRGASASEAAFKTLASGARMIHLATHGFFLGEGCPSATDGSRSTTGGGVAPAVTGESPLLLSGFALAGANHRDAAGPDEEDGILTAEEIASLNLTGVEWAVLSACDTGLGEVRVGEGVFGLRRAFQVAGARTLIMSLWPVEDEASRRWMKALYQNRFAKGMSTIDAVHEANLEVLRHRREAGLSTHPAHWAGFIASGDWR